ncbi:hypothetical protein ACTFIW_006748 [Dictyostelium discoideum]
MERMLETNETFSISGIIENEIEQRESFINDTSKILELLFKQFNITQQQQQQPQNNENKLINETFSMVFELFKEMLSPLYSLVNEDMMPNIFELYQMTEDLRYYFALFNGDIKNKLNNITTTTKVLRICNNKKELIKELIKNQYDIDRKPIDQQSISNLRKEEKEKGKEKENENEKEKENQELDKKVNQTNENEKDDENENEIKDCFFLLFQLFTSIVYNLQSNCEKLLLQSIDISKNNFKRQFYNHLIKRDLNYLENLTFRLNLINDLNKKEEKEEKEKEENSFDTFSKLFLNDKQQKENTNNNIINNNLLESFQIIFSNYIEKNNLNVDLILESFNN